MPQKQIAGTTIDVNEEGYLTNHAQWNREVAAALAQELGITLTDAHWKVLEFIDKDFQEKGGAGHAPNEQGGRDSHQGSLHAVPGRPHQEGCAHQRLSQTGQLRLRKGPSHG